MADQTPTHQTRPMETDSAKKTPEQASTASDKSLPPATVRNDVAPSVTKTDKDDSNPLGETKEQKSEAKRRDALLKSPEDTHPEGKDAPTTDHIPHYNETHATPGVPYQENPLNPGMNPTILPGPAPSK